MENIVAKGEIARFEQFLLSHYVFKKPSAAEASESVKSVADYSENTWEI